MVESPHFCSLPQSYATRLGCGRIISRTLHFDSTSNTILIMPLRIQSSLIQILTAIVTSTGQFGNTLPIFLTPRQNYGNKIMKISLLNPEQTLWRRLTKVSLCHISDVFRNYPLWRSVSSNNVHERRRNHGKLCLNQLPDHPLSSLPSLLGWIELDLQ
jgi:hypothetical protein